MSPCPLVPLSPHSPFPFPNSELRIPNSEFNKTMPKFILINSKQPSRAREIHLNPEMELNQECLIGRDPRCCLVLDDSLVSGQHGKLCLRQGRYSFQDLGSRNGSRLNNEAVKSGPSYNLKPSDVLHIGPFTLLVQSLEETEVTSVTRSADDYMPLAAIDPAKIDRWTQGKLTVRCVEVIEETVDVKTFVFVASPPRLFTYQPGQFVTLDLEIDGKRVMRSYSISSTPSRPHTLELTVKRVPPPSDAPDAPPGLVSNWLHDNIQPGSEIQLDGPMGHFTCFQKPAAKMLFISAGSGITPMMSMSRWLCDTASEVDIIFLHSARTPSDIIYRQELEMMAARYPRFTVAATMTRSNPGQAWLGYRGRIDETLIRAVAPDFQERSVFVCGPNPFMAGVKATLETLDFPMENYTEESFGGPKKTKKVPTVVAETLPPEDSSAIALRPALFETISPAVPVPIFTNGNGHHAETVSTTTIAAPPETRVCFHESGIEAIADAEDTILDIAEAEGVNIRSGCRMGACGACAVKLRSGVVEYACESGALGNLEDGEILACIAHPQGRVEIEA